MADSDSRRRLISSTPRLTREEITSQAFPQAFRGISETAVRGFLRRLADEYDALRVRAEELTALVERLETEVAQPPPPIEEQDLLTVVGEETARVLRSAKESADEIRRSAEEKASALVAQAQEEARTLREETEQAAADRLREAEEGAAHTLREAERLAREIQEGTEARMAEMEAKAEAEARAEVENARRKAKELVAEAQATRDRMLQELARRRDALESQLDALRSGRDRLLEGYRVVRRTLEEATEALRDTDARPAAAAPGRPRVSSAALPTQGMAPEPAPEPERAPEPEPEPEPAPAPPAQPRVSGAAKVGSITLGELPEVRREPEPAPEPEPTPEAVPVEDEPPAAPEPEVAPEEAEPVAPVRAEGAEDEVEELFARLRTEVTPPAEAEEPAAEAPVEAEPEEEEGEEPAAPAEDEAPAPAAGAGDPVEAAVLRFRGEVLESLVEDMVRRVKRVVRDEENLVLESVRTHKGVPQADDVLPPLADQEAAFAEATSDVLASAWMSGGEVAHEFAGAPGPNGSNGSNGSGATAPSSDLASLLARELMTPLRARLGDALSEAGTSDDREVEERVRSRYREWKSSRIDGAVRDALAAAFARGLYDALPAGAELRWVVGGDQPCPDCADNALEATARGGAFPTGHLHPPAHPGCHCVVVPTEIPAVAEAGSGPV